MALSRLTPGLRGQQPPSEHTHRVAVVTGGKSGIGRGVVERLAREGTRVHAFDIAAHADDAGMSPTAGSVTEHEVDVRSEAAVETAFQRVLAAEGQVHYLVCCAGVYRSIPFLQLPRDEWHRTMQVNLTGAFLCCRAAARHMTPRGFGRIVIVSSMAARKGVVAGAHYAASKGGLLGLMRSLALEVAGSGVQVNSVSPGITDTPQPRGNMSDAEIYARAAAIPLGRIATVEDVVEAILFLLGEEGSFITGQDVRVNGGEALW